MADSDYELLDAWRAGEESAGQALFARHFDSVYRFFFNKAQEATDDLVQQTFLSCVESKDDFRKQASFRTYLFCIARNRLLKEVRGNARRRDDAPAVTGAEQFSVAAAMAKRQEQRLLLRALRELPLEMQMALELSYWEDLTDRELGELLEVPMGTVKSRLRKGRQLLEQAMAKLSQSPEQLRSTVDNFEAWAKSIRGLGPDQ
ncbi:MAG: sigma-70 family RNA polymerase sigma factor [Myxococcota bacterium]